MIKKLQRKFIMITMGTLVLVMLVLVGSINAINIYQMEHRVGGAIKILSDNRGKFPKFEKDNPPKMKPQLGFQMNEETQFETRYFIVKIDEDSSIIEIDTSHSAVTSEDAANYAHKILSKSKQSGYEGIYKYAVVDETYGKMIVFLDCRSQMQTATIFLLTSFCVALITLLFLFIPVSIFSKKAIHPFIESMEKQKLFITDAGHEIKTPLAIISANADVLELTNGKSEWITSIRNQTMRLDKLVKNMLTLAKMDEDNIKLVFAEFDLSEVVIETTDSFVPIAKAKNKKFYMDIEPELKYYGDVGSIGQLISTLVDNALKYSNEEGTIKISLHPTKKGVKLEVFNTIDAIEDYSKENLNKLFHRFYRSDSSRSRDTGGYGIGLSIAKSIVEAHQGKISVRSENGTSICFTVRM